jgi:hypothetical protein
MMEAILGPLPPRFSRTTSKTKYFWHGQLYWDSDSPDGKYVRDTCRKLKVSTVSTYQHEMATLLSPLALILSPPPSLLSSLLSRSSLHLSGPHKRVTAIHLLTLPTGKESGTECCHKHGEGAEERGEGAEERGEGAEEGGEGGFSKGAEERGGR